MFSGALSLTGCLGQTEAPRNSAAQAEGKQGQGLDILAWQEMVTQAYSVTRPGASPVSRLLPAETRRRALERKLALTLLEGTRAQLQTHLPNTCQAAVGSFPGPTDGLVTGTWAK